MNIIQTPFKKFDQFQQRHSWLAFPIAVIKKYGDDQAGNRAALLTYYGFLALFPLLLVLTTVVQMVAANDPAFQQRVIDAATSYFPVLGDQLYSHINSLHQTGIALAVGIVFTLYGARGVAEAFRQGVNRLWGIPRSRQTGFPKSTLQSLVIILVGGFGFILAGICTGLAAHAGHGMGFRALSLAVNIFILFWLFVFLLDFSLPKHITFKERWLGALAIAIGLVILQLFGTFLLTKQLKSLDALYSYFALALGLLFWIYLQAQVVFYSIEIATVKNNKMWPRSLITAPKLNK